MTKLSKASWRMLISGIFVIVFAGLGMAYSQQSQDQSRLSLDLAQAQLILAKTSPDELSSQEDELEKRLAQSQSQLETLKASLSPVLQSIEASDALFDIAKTCGVEVVGSRSTATSTEKLSGINYSTLWLMVKLEGQVANIVRFIHTWTEENPTGVVKSVKINVPEITDEEAEETIEEAGEEEGEELGDTGEQEEPVGEGEEEAGEEEGEELDETGEQEEPTGEEEEGTGEEESEEEIETGGKRPSADIELIIYTYRGD